MVSDGGEEFGEERLEAVLRRARARSAAEGAAAIMDEVAAFGGGSRAGDVTVVAIRGM